MNIRLKPLALAVSGTISCAALADDATQDAATIVVTATRFAAADPRVPANISVITREDIRNSPALDLPDVLKSRAGVNVRALYGNMGIDATVDLRGFGDAATSNTLILLDGQRLNPIDMATVSWSAIPLDSVRRIEIIRGAGTVLYGNQACGGVINIVTDKVGKPGAWVSAGVGSYGYRAINAYGAGGSDAGYFNVYAHGAASDGWRRNSRQEQEAISGRGGLYLDKGEVALDYAIYRDASGLPGYLLPDAYRNDPRSTTSPDDKQHRDGYRLRPGIKLVLGDNLTFEGEISSEHEDQHADYASFGSKSDRTKDNQSVTPRLRWRHGLGTLASETVLGIDYYHGEVSAHYSSAPNQSAGQTSSAFYFQNSTALTDAWTLTVGGRSQRMDQDAHQQAYAAWFAPAMDGSAKRSRNAYDLGASYQGQGWRIYGKTGTTFRFPNTDELFGYDPFTGNPVFAGNLRPQHGSIEEAGGSMTAGPVQWRASIYRLDLSDEIGYDGASFANVNFDPTRHQGLESELDWRIGDGWRASLAYAYTDASFRDGPYAGKRLPSVPRDKATLQVTWDASKAGTYTASVNYVGPRPYSGDLANTQGNEGTYTTVDLRGTWNVKPWTVSARLLNAFDKRYAALAGYASYLMPPSRYYYPADGRSLFIDVRYDFK